jgi:hypothetical protein
MALPPVTAAAPGSAAGPVAPASRFGEVLRARLAHPVRPPPGPAAPPALRLLEAVDRARVHLDGALAEARRGRVFPAGELLALQAEAYRAGQTLELASKVVEQGAQSVRQAVGTQV